jgi:DNA-binding IclR family transcriptional regulator
MAALSRRHIYRRKKSHYATTGSYDRAMTPRPSPQTDRVVRLIEMLAAGDGTRLSLAEVSRRLAVHKASCHSMLAKLLDAGWLQRDSRDRTYQLGPALVRLGAAAARRFPALERARPIMAELSAVTGAHCIAFSIGRDHVTVVDQIRSPRGAGHPMAVGTELPVQPPFGATLATWLPAAEREEWLAGLPARVQGHYRRALNLSRRRGFAVGLHVLADLRLQEIASLVRATETRGGRLGDLARAMTEELMASEDWCPDALVPRRRYHVSHIDSPVIGPGGRPALMLSLVPVPSEMTGAETSAMGRRLATCTGELSDHGDQSGVG